MEDLQQKIIELMDLFDDEQVTTADKIDRPQRALDREAIDDFMKRNPMAAGGMLAQPSADGSRQEYATSTVKTKKFKYPKNYYNQKTKKVETVYMDKPPKSSAKEVGSGKFSMGERNRVTRIKYPEYNSYAELLKKEPAKAKNVMATLQYSSVAGSKIKKKTQFDSLTKIQQNKILAEFPDADFSKGKFGFNSKVDQTNFKRVKAFVNRGYKPRFKSLPLKVQDQIKEKFSYFTDWDFKKFKYGIPDSATNIDNRRLMMKVKTFINDPKPFIFGFSFDRPGSWMLQQMYRSWEFGNPDYKPIYNKNNKVIGMKEKGKAYYANENVAPSKKTKLINSHPEFNKVQKFVDIANEAKLPLKDLTGYKNTKALMALFPEGYESIKFSDLTNYLYQEQGADITRNAIEKHHLKNLSDMGSPIDSKNLQLLRQDLNTLGNTITQQIKAGDVSRVGDLEKAGVKIVVDGKTYGKGFQDPRLQMNRIIGDVTQKISSLDKTQFENMLASFGDGTCAVQFGPKKRDGGRIGYQVGTIDKKRCIDQGIKNFQEGKFKTADQAQDAARLLGGGKNVLRAITKYGIVPEAAFVAGEAVFRNILGEKPLNAIKKSIDTFTFGLTDFTSGIEAEKFGKDADRKLAVDKFRASQNKVNSIEQQIANLETLNTGSQFGYEGDQTEAIQMKKVELEAAKKELEQNYVNPDIVQYIDRKAENIADAQMAKSGFAKASLKDQMDGIPGVADYMDTETARVFPKQPSQEELNLNLLPNFKEALKTKEAKMDRVILNAPDDVLQNISPEALELKKGLQEAYKMENLKDTFGAEQIYGTQGSFFGEPLAKGGRAGFKSGALRKGIQALIDESVKKTPKDTTSALDKLIKETLDEDLFDKKDRIIDQINISEAKKRKNLPYNMRVFEEPKNLDFYDAIIKSNFRTKTGPYFDRIRRLKKAGGGLLKQAGDRSGPPPESGPNPQGLQGLLNRVKNI